MTDLEDRLRHDLQSEARRFEPSPDLSDRISQRIGQRTRRNHVLAVAAALVIVVAGAGGVLTLRQSADDQDIRMGGNGRQSTSTTEPERETSTSSTSTAPTTPDPTATTRPQQTDPTATSSTSTTTAPAPQTPAIGPDTPLSRHGVGPIRAGMTIRQAEEAAGITLETDPAAWENFGRSCSVFTINGVHDGRLGFAAWTPGNVPSDDPETAVIHAIGGSDSVTEEGIGRGAAIEELHAAHGQPTSTVQDTLGTGEILLYEQDGYSYGFRVWDGLVQEIRSGHVNGVGEFEPCG